MFRLPKRSYYSVRDLLIPAEVGEQENIILTLDGMKALAAYYKEKYEIDIIPFAASMGDGEETWLTYAL